MNGDNLVIDEEALVRAMQSGKVNRVGLDVSGSCLLNQFNSVRNIVYELGIWKGARRTSLPIDYSSGNTTASWVHFSFQ